MSAVGPHAFTRTHTHTWIRRCQACVGAPPPPPPNPLGWASAQRHRQPSTWGQARGGGGGEGGKWWRRRTYSHCLPAFPGEQLHLLFLLSTTPWPPHRVVVVAVTDVVVGVVVAEGSMQVTFVSADDPPLPLQLSTLSTLPLPLHVAAEEKISSSAVAHLFPQLTCQYALSGGSCVR